MQRRGLVVLMTVLATAFVATPASADGNVNFLIGERRFENDFWEDADLDRQGLFGANIDYGDPAWPVRVMFGVHSSGAFDWESGDDAFDFDQDPEAVVIELSAGAAWMPLEGRTRPYIGLGVSRVGAWIDLVDEDYDSTFAFYANGGIFWRLGSSFNFGFDVRTLQGADLRFDAIDLGFAPGTYPNDRLEIDADHLQFSFAIGFGWPEVK